MDSSVRSVQNGTQDQDTAFIQSRLIACGLAGNQGGVRHASWMPPKVYLLATSLFGPFLTFHPLTRRAARSGEPFSIVSTLASLIESA